MAEGLCEITPHPEMMKSPANTAEHGLLRGLEVM
jgi:hypothetical protein